MQKSFSFLILSVILFIAGQLLGQGVLPISCTDYSPQPSSQYMTGEAISVDYFDPKDDIPFQRLSLQNRWSSTNNGQTEFFHVEIGEFTTTTLTFNVEGIYNFQRNIEALNPPLLYFCAISNINVTNPDPFIPSTFKEDDPVPDVFITTRNIGAIYALDGSVQRVFPLVIGNTGDADLEVFDVSLWAETGRLELVPVNLEFDNIVAPGEFTEIWLKPVIPDHQAYMQAPILDLTVQVLTNDPDEPILFPSSPFVQPIGDGYRLPIVVRFTYFNDLSELPSFSIPPPIPEAQNAEDNIDFILGRYWLKKDINRDSLIDAGDLVNWPNGQS